MLTVKLPNRQRIFNPSDRCLAEWRLRIATNGTCRNLSVVFDQHGAFTPRIVEAMVGLPITGFRKTIAVEPHWQWPDLDMARRLARLPIANFSYEGRGFTCPIAGVLESLPITHLELGMCCLPGEIANTLAAFRLSHLRLRECYELSTETFKAMARLPLTNLSLQKQTSGDQGIKELSVAMFAELPGLQRLENLDLSSSDVTAAMLQELAGLPITRLAMSRCPLTVEMIKALANLPVLRYLDLSRCHLTLEMIEILAAVPSLGSLNLSRCQSTDGTLDLWRTQFPGAQSIADDEDE